MSLTNFEKTVLKLSALGAGAALASYVFRGDRKARKSSVMTVLVDHPPLPALFAKELDKSTSHPLLSPSMLRMLELAVHTCILSRTRFTGKRRSAPVKMDTSSESSQSTTMTDPSSSSPTRTTPQPRHSSKEDFRKKRRAALDRYRNKRKRNKMPKNQKR